MQTIYSDLEVIVVDDGSRDATSDVARASGATVIRHRQRRGVSVARNAGIRQARAATIAFVDDDCEPSPEWAHALLGSYEADVVAVGGSLVAGAGPGVVCSYLARHNPLAPQEVELRRSANVLYRFFLYLRSQWLPTRQSVRREVTSLPTANLSARRDALLEVGGFDERIIFGAEDEDLCRRLALAFPAMRLIFDPDAKVVHHFEPSISAMMRRRRSYGRASALMFRKWPDVGPTFFPFPSIILVLLILAVAFPPALVVALLLPVIFYPLGPLAAARRRDLRLLADSYLQLLEEASDNIGFIDGLWRYRHTFGQQ